MNAEEVDFRALDDIVANADISGDGGDEGYELAGGSDTDANMPFLLPSRGLKGPNTVSGSLSIIVRIRLPVQERGGVVETEHGFGVFHVMSRQQLVHFLHLIIISLARSSSRALEPAVHRPSPS